MSSSASAAWEASHSFFIFPQFVSSRRVGLVLLQWAVDCVGGGGCHVGPPHTGPRGLVMCILEKLVSAPADEARE